MQERLNKQRPISWDIADGFFETAKIESRTGQLSSSTSKVDAGARQEETDRIELAQAIREGFFHIINLPPRVNNCYSWYFLNRMDALCPPKPNVLLIAASIFQSLVPSVT